MSGLPAQVMRCFSPEVVVLWCCREMLFFFAQLITKGLGDCVTCWEQYCFRFVNLQYM